MRKRQIAIIPLIFASMIMLLSSIMPHHHHGKLICFTPHMNTVRSSKKNVTMNMTQLLPRVNVKSDYYSRQVL